MTDSELLDGLDRLMCGHLSEVGYGQSASIRLRVQKKSVGVSFPLHDYAAGTNPHATTLRGAIEAALKQKGTP